MNKVFLEGTIQGKISQGDGYKDFKVYSTNPLKEIGETNFVRLLESRLGEDLKEGDEVIILDGRITDSKVKGLKFIEAKEVRKIG